MFKQDWGDREDFIIYKRLILSKPFNYKTSPLEHMSVSFHTEEKPESPKCKALAIGEQMDIIQDIIYELLHFILY